MPPVNSIGDYMGKVIYAPFETTLDIDTERILNAAKDKLEGVIILGYTKEGEEYFASSYSDAREIVFLLDRLHHFIIGNGELVHGE
jgi:hypothetical protein